MRSVLWISNNEARFRDIDVGSQETEINDGKRDRKNDDENEQSIELRCSLNLPKVTLPVSGVSSVIAGLPVMGKSSMRCDAHDWRGIKPNQGKLLNPN